LDFDEARAYLRDNHRAVLATMRSDGTPQMSPVTVGVDDAGRAVISSRETAYKVRNLRRTPRAWLCAFSDRFFGRPWIQIEGDVEIVSLPEAMDGLIAYYRGIAGDHPDWNDYRAAMHRDQRVLLRLTLTRAGPDRHG
jgi:PPOX class probable F420-dependent enzyme